MTMPMTPTWTHQDVVKGLLDGADTVQRLTNTSPMVSRLLAGAAGKQLLTQQGPDQIVGPIGDAISHDLIGPGTEGATALAQSIQPILQGFQSSKPHYEVVRAPITDLAVLDHLGAVHPAIQQTAALSDQLETLTNADQPPKGGQHPLLNPGRALAIAQRDMGLGEGEAKALVQATNHLIAQRNQVAKVLLGMSAKQPQETAQIVQSLGQYGPGHLGKIVAAVGDAIQQRALKHQASQAVSGAMAANPMDTMRKLGVAGPAGLGALGASAPAGQQALGAAMGRPGTINQPVR